MDVCQPFIKFSQNQDITKYLSVSQFLGVKLGVDFEVFSDFGVQTTVLH